MKKRQFRKHRPLFRSPLPKDVSKPKTKWKVLPILWAALKRTCMVLGAFMLVSLTLSLISLLTVKAPELPKIPKQAVLYLEFKDSINEVPKQASFTDPFAGSSPTLRNYINAIDIAAKDDRVLGIAARMYDGQFSLSQIEELRAALKRFKETGKFTKIYSSSYGGTGSGLGRFYLASVFDERWMQPMGIVSISGVRAEVPFFKEVLDTIGVQPEFYQKKEFKTAYESVMRESMSPENKRMMQDIVKGVRNIILSEMPADLGLEPDQFETLVDEAIFTDDVALQEGLITHSDYADVMVDQMKADILGDAESEETLFVGVPHYLKMNKNKTTVGKVGNPKVALIYAVGAIMSTNGEDFAKDGIAASEIIAPAIMEAADDETIEAIVLRVDSPGGSPVASETILRAIHKAQEKGKPVIVSMGATAASGGYWIASSADTIFALPSTLTGSIGVVGGKVAVQELWEKIGVNWNTDVQWGENAGIWSFNTLFSNSEGRKVNMMLDHVYDSFVTRVAEGRGMEYDQAEKLAHGRVWTGAQALERGLVDQLGGLGDALDYTAQLLEREASEDLDVIVLPKPKTFQEQLVDLLANSGAVYSGLKTQAQMMDVLQPVVQEAQIIGAGEPLLTYEPLRIQ